MAPPKRKLNFDTTLSDTTLHFEEDSSFPKEWKIEGDNIDKRVQKLREDLREKGVGTQPNAVVDAKSKFRTEYRRIQTAHSIVSDALALHQKEVDWFSHSTQMMENDIEALHNRREHVDSTVNELKANLVRLDSSVGILKSQQLAVKSVLELREDEYMDDDVDSNLPDEYEKFSKISKLCDVALKSYDIIKKRNDEMQKALMTERNRHRKQHEAVLNSMDRKEKERIDQLDDLFKDYSLDQLKALRDRMRQARK